MSETFQFAVAGAGIVGLSTALALAERHPGARIVVLEKEDEIGKHQTGHSSGVIHSGIYYRPGSLKARLAREGSRAMVEFCREHGIPHEVCGKVIVATEPEELPLLDGLYERGVENGLDVRKVDAEGLRELEPHAAGRAAIHVPSAGITDFHAVARAYARLLAEKGVELRLGTLVAGVHERKDGATVETGSGTLLAELFVNCAGLHSDRLARSSGMLADASIVPFRGEYYELRSDRRHLVKNLIYPVPDPRFPFLGVHLTRMIDGSVHAGPNAVLGLAREGYRKRDVNLRDTAEVLRFPGFWRLAARHARAGAREVRRSLSKRAFVRSLQRLVPEIREEDVVPAPAGVRAQALRPDGSMVDDFLIETGPRSVHVLNAPSPAATASLGIGSMVADRVDTLHPMEIA